MSRCGTKMAARWGGMVSVLGVVAVMASGVDARVCQAGSHTYDSPELLSYYKLDDSVVDEKNPNDASKNLILAGTGGNAELDSSNPFFGTHSAKLTNDDGLQTYLEVPSFQVTEAFSLSFWFQWDLSNMYDNNWSKLFHFSQTFGDFELTFSRNNANAYGYFVIWKASGVGIEYHQNTEFNFGDNVWRHLVLIVNRNADMQVYLDGSYVTRTNTAANKLEAGKLPLWTGTLTMDKNYIGRHGDSNRDNFDGYVDEIQIYDKALSLVEVEQIYELRGNPCASCPPETPYTSPDQPATSAAECTVAPATCETLTVTASPAASAEGDVTSSMVKYMAFDGIVGYTVTFPSATTGEALVVSSSTYTHVPTLDLPAGTYTVIVGARESVWKKGAAGSTCDATCALVNLECDGHGQSLINDATKVGDAFALAGYTCQSYGASGLGYPGTPFSTGRSSDDCYFFSPNTDGGGHDGLPFSSCSANAVASHAPLCKCVSLDESKIVDANGVEVAGSAGGNVFSQTFDFTSKDTLDDWETYATSAEVGGTVSFESYQENTNIAGEYYMWSGSETVGYFELPLPAGYNSVTITYGSGGWEWGALSAWAAYADKMYVKLCLCSSGGNECTHASCDVIETIQATYQVPKTSTQTMTYTAGQVLRVEEKMLTVDMNMIIVLKNIVEHDITGVLKPYGAPQVVVKYNAIVCPTTDTDKPACDEGVSVFSFWLIRKC